MLSVTRISKPLLMTNRLAGCEFTFVPVIALTRNTTSSVVQKMIGRQRRTGWQS